MNRLECPECHRSSFCASLRGPVYCAHDDCGVLLLPGGETDDADPRRDCPRIDTDTSITVEYLLDDVRRIERDRSLVDASIVGVSVILQEVPPIGSDVVLVLSNAGKDGRAARVKGVVREVGPAEATGFRIGIEVVPPLRPVND